MPQINILTIESGIVFTMTDYVVQMWTLAAQGDRQGVWFWAAVYVFFICGYSVLRQIFTRNWHSTRGQLEHIGLEKFGSASVLPEQDYRGDALYSYEVEGRTYQGKRISPWIIIASHTAKFVLKRQLSKVETFQGGTATVYYNPNNPAKSWLILPSKLGIAITILISVLPAMSYWLEFYG
jgi:hypothetical protein